MRGLKILRNLTKITLKNMIHKIKIDLMKIPGARRFTAKDNVEHIAIPATALYMGAKAAYLDLDMKENRDGEDQYGNTHFIAISPTKEQREAKERTPIVGNAKTLTFGDKPKPAAPSVAEEEEDTPF
jgi:hypothetical protein